MQVHAVPQNDLSEHVLTDDCWCDPTVQWIDPETGLPYRNGQVVIHNAADGREAAEELLGDGLGEHKQWDVVPVET